MIFVGKVLSVENGIGMSKYEIQDETGTLKVHSFDFRPVPTNITIVPVGSFARVVANPKVIQGEKIACALAMFDLGTDDKVVSVERLSLSALLS
jgi:hypothetical protein